MLRRWVGMEVRAKSYWDRSPLRTRWEARAVAHRAAGAGHGDVLRGLTPEIGDDDLLVGRFSSLPPSPRMQEEPIQRTEHETIR